MPDSLSLRPVASAEPISTPEPFGQSTAEFCAPPPQVSSSSESAFVAETESAELCPVDPQSPYAQKLFAENPPPLSGTAEVGTVSGEAEVGSGSVAGGIVEGVYIFLGTFSFLYQLFS